MTTKTIALPHRNIGYRPGDEVRTETRMPWRNPDSGEPSTDVRRSRLRVISVTGRITPDGIECVVEESGGVASLDPAD